MKSVNRWLRPLQSVLYVGLAGLVIGQGLPEVNAGIIEEGEKRNQAMLHITHLTEKIGPRLLGSTNLTKACQWTVDEFKKWGLSNVHIENYMDVPIGFDRGKTQVARMISPYRRDFVFTTPAWTPGTNGCVKGPAYMEPSTSEEVKQKADQLKGAWIVVDTQAVTRRTRVDPARIERRKLIESKGIAGWIYSSGGELVTTNGTWEGLDIKKLPTIPTIIVRASDMRAIRAEISISGTATLEFDIDNRFVTGPIKVGNVIADIPGTEKPDEYIIIGAHLDSWDGPGSQGACDNGTGATAVIEAARILSKMKVKPKKTIRFVLFTGEEEGLFGSIAYVRQHESELNKISCVLVDDSGTNYISGLMCHESIAPVFERASEPLRLQSSGFQFAITRSQTPPSRKGGGSDHAPFLDKGVPAFFMRKTGKANYFDIWHTQNDNLRQVIPENLKRSGLVFAVLAYNLACTDDLLPRLP